MKQTSRMLFAGLTSLILSSCSSGGGGQNSGPTGNPHKKPAHNERPQVDLQEAYQISGPNKETISVPKGGNLGSESVVASQGQTKDIVQKNEIAVSKVLTIKTSTIDYLSAAEMIQVQIPVTSAQALAQPEKLTGKVRLSTGAIFPVKGVFDPQKRTYTLPLAGIMTDWSIGVVINPKQKTISSEHSDIAKTMGWLTELKWETCEWEAVIHNDMTEADVQSKILPDAKTACEALDSLGVRAPRLWVVERNSQKMRVFHVIDDGSYFSGNGADDKPDYLANATEEEMLALGQMYISYKQYEDLKARFGIELGNILIHELFHGVQWGYDIRFGRQDKITSLKAYYEGTATPIGQTYQFQNTVNGPDVAARDLRDGEFMALDSAVDDPFLNYYKKQTFFAYVAKKFNGGSFSYTHQLFEQLAMSAYPHVNKTIAEYLPLYRQGMNTAFLSEFNKPLSDIYYEFAEDRALIHSPGSVIHKVDLESKPYTLSENFFEKKISNIDYVIENTTEVKYEGIEPLSMRVMKVILPMDLCVSNCPPETFVDLKIKLNGFDPNSSDFKLVTYAMDMTTQKVIASSRREITDILSPVRFSTPRGKTISHVVLIMNGSTLAQKLDFYATSGAVIDYTLQTDAKTGDIIELHGSGFGDEQKDSQVIWNKHSLKVLSWSDSTIQVEVTSNLETKKAPLHVRIGGKETNKIDINIRNTSLNSYKLQMAYDSRAISKGSMILPISVTNGRVTFSYNESGLDNGDEYTLEMSGDGSYDGTTIRISGIIKIRTQNEYFNGTHKIVTTEQEDIEFGDANGKWSMNIFFPGKTGQNRAHYIYHQTNPHPDIEDTHFELDPDPDVQIWEWAE